MIAETSPGRKRPRFSLFSNDIRFQVVGCLVLFVAILIPYFFLTQPQAFDGFISQAQSDFLYSGNLLNIAQEKNTFDKYSLSLSELLEEEEAHSALYSSSELGGGDSATDLYSIPLDNRDEFDNLEQNSAKLVSEDPVSTFSADVDTSSYSYIRRMIKEGSLPQSDAVRSEEMINYFNYDYPPPRSMYQPFNATVAVSGAPWDEGGRKVIHIGVKGYDVKPSEKRFSNLVFLVDTSGSMSSSDRLPLVKRSIEMLLPTLDPEDYVSIVSYDHDARVDLHPTPVQSKGKILRVLVGLHAGGGTGGAGGLKLAYDMAERHYDKDAVNRILLATDGDFNVGPTDNDALRKFVESKRDKGIYLSVLGFGMGNYKDSRMKALANHGNGVAVYIDSIREARKVLVTEAGGTIFPIADDVKFQVEFNPATVSSYKLIGYEKRLLEREDFNDDKVDAGDVGSGHTVTAMYEITPKGSKSPMVDELRYRTATADEGCERSNSEEKDGDHSNCGEYGFLKMRFKLPGETESKLMSMPIRSRDSVTVYGESDAGGTRSTKGDVVMDLKGSSTEQQRILSTTTGAEMSHSRLRREFDFATAVAGFAQLLRDGRRGDWEDSIAEGESRRFGYHSVLALAKANVGEDEHGYRAEFVELVRKAKLLANCLGNNIIHCPPHYYNDWGAVDDDDWGAVDDDDWSAVDDDGLWGDGDA